MPRSSESFAALASALAKAQTELVNPEKSLTATIRTGRAGEAERTFRYAPFGQRARYRSQDLGQARDRDGADHGDRCCGRHGSPDHDLGPQLGRMDRLRLAGLPDGRDRPSAAHGGRADLCPPLRAVHAGRYCRRRRSRRAGSQYARPGGGSDDSACSGGCGEATVCRQRACLCWTEPSPGATARSRPSGIGPPARRHARGNPGSLRRHRRRLGQDHAGRQKQADGRRRATDRGRVREPISQACLPIRSNRSRGKSWSLRSRPVQSDGAAASNASPETGVARHTASIPKTVRHRNKEHLRFVRIAALP